MTKYRLTDEQYSLVMEASKPVPLILLQCGTPSSTQQNVNVAWQRVAKEHGCKWDTIAPALDGDPHNFLAEPL